MSEAAHAVAWLLEQSEPEARRLAAQQLVKVKGPRAAELLLRALSDEDWRVRKEAAVTAAGMEPREDVVAALVTALNEKRNIGLRNAAVEALVAIGPDAVPASIEALEHLDADGRKLAIEILGGIPDERGITALTRALVDEDVNVRSAAAENLGCADRAGEYARSIAIAALTATLGSDEVFLKLAALDALTRLDADLPWNVFEPFARDSVLRRYAIAAAARSDEDGALDTLAAATVDPSRTIVREAILAIGDRILHTMDPGPFSARMQERLRAQPGCHDRVASFARQTDDVPARGAAFITLSLFGEPEDIALFVEALVDDNLSAHAEKALQAYGPDAVGPLLRMARGEAPALRATALTLVPTLAPPAEQEDVRETVRVSLADESPEVVAASLRVLAHTGEPADLERVGPLALHEDSRISGAASLALSAIATRYPEQARSAFRDVEPSEPGAMMACLLLAAVAKVGPLAEDEIAFLERALANGGTRTRRAAIDALSLVRDEAAMELVAFALADEEHDVQLAAIRALGVMGHVEPLVTLLRSETDPGLVAAALRALGTADGEATVQAARPLLRAPDAAIACVAVEALGRLSNPRHRDAIFDALDHPEPEVVKMALSELATSLDPRAVLRIATCLDHEAWEVRRLACELLAGQTKDGVPGLLRSRLERERDPVVRDALRVALSTRPTPPEV